MNQLKKSWKWKLLLSKMFTCSRCSFQHPFEWALNEHMYVKHDIRTDMTPRGKIPCAPTTLSVGPNGGRAPTKVSVPPIRSRGAQSGLGVEYEDSESEHGDTDEEAVDDEQSVHDSEGTVDETVDEEMDADDGGDVSENDDDDSEDEEDTFHLLYMIDYIGAIHEYC